MDKKPLIVVSLCAVVLLVMTSLSNVVGYQTVQTSQQNLIKERINQRELAFQTIVDIANNKEIQRIIFKSQMSSGIFPTSEIPVVTKQQLRQMYFIGLILSKVISTSRMQSMIQKDQLINPEIQKELSNVIEKDASIKNEINQLSKSACDCENENHTVHSPPIICYIINNTILRLNNGYGFLHTLLHWASEHNRPLFARTIILFIEFQTYIGIPILILGMLFNCLHFYNPLSKGLYDIPEMR
jgi:hypothetical protein